MNVLKPFVLIACVAFVAGFMGYVALARITLAPEAPVAVAQAPMSSTVSQPTAPPADDFNPGKLI